MQKSSLDNNKPKTTELVISKTGKKALSKNQQEFNKLTIKIEKLQKEIEKKQDKLNHAVKVYGAELYPLKKKFSVENKKNIVLLWEHYKANKLSKKDQKTLKEIVSEELEYLLDGLTEEPDAELKKLYKEIEGRNFDDDVKEDEDATKKILKEFLKNAKVDLSDIDINDGEALYQKMFEHESKMHNANPFERKNVRTKTKSAKQIEAEKIEAAAEELKKKNISTIYKQLAKLFHPDLEQDEERKVEKMLLMQELTAAYEAKNLHALLTLELKWIHKENDHLESLTEEKLAVYLQILKEQVNDLTEQKRAIILHPQYNILFEEYGMEVHQYPLETIQRDILNITKQIKNLKELTFLFESDYALTHVKQYIKKWKADQAEMEDDDELFDLLFGR